MIKFPPLAPNCPLVEKNDGGLLMLQSRDQNELNPHCYRMPFIGAVNGSPFLLEVVARIQYSAWMDEYERICNLREGFHPLEVDRLQESAKKNATAWSMYWRSK